MTSRTLELIALGKDQASNVLNKVGGSVVNLGSVAAGVATGGLALAGAAIVAVGAAAVGAGVMVFNFSQDTNQAMKLFGAQTGLAGDELESFKDTAKDVYAAGLGESIGEVVDQMSLVYRGLGETGDALEDSTRRAMTLAEVFNVDVGESINWVSSMTKSWEMDSEAAFDTITKGMQTGLDVAGDFGDTLLEYSGDFDRLGFSADQMLSILNAGLEAGAYNTDVIADGFREMSIRLMEGGDDMSEVFASMGLDFETMQASVAAGDETWGDYTTNIVEGLLAIESEVERNAAGAAIFGSKWEDVGGDVFLAAGLATQGIEGVGGATDAAAEQMATGIMPALERLKRKFMTEFEPLGDKAGEVINKMVPFLETAAEWLGRKVPLAISWLEDKWETYWPKAQSTLTEFWAGIQPALIWVKDMLNAFTEGILPRLTVAWDILNSGWQEIVNMYNVHLKPALEALWVALGIGEVKSGDIGEAFGAFSGIMIAFFTSGVIEGIKVGIAGISLAATAAKDAVNWLRGAFEGIRGILDAVSNKISWMKNRIWDVIWAFRNLSLPSWLTPGSPTPLELGLIGVGKAFSALPAAIPIGVGAAGEGRGAGGGTTVFVTNHFGRDSIREDADIMRVVDQITQSLELRGIGVML